MTGFKYTLSGRVQGVGLRWLIKAKADELKLLGSVQNMDDGSVVIHVCGDSWQLEQFDNFLNAKKLGNAQLNNIDKDSSDFAELPLEFSIN